MVWKIHILTLLFLSLTSLNKPPAVTSIHFWSLRWKIGQITTRIPCFAFFCDCATLSQLSLLNSLITRATPSGNWCSYIWVCFILMLYLEFILWRILQGCIVIPYSAGFPFGYGLFISHCRFVYSTIMVDHVSKAIVCLLNQYYVCDFPGLLSVYSIK